MRWTAWAALVAGIGAAIGAYAFAQEKKDVKTRFFEIRTYTVNPGKMEALHKRFRDHTNRLFTKHGIEMVGYWNVVKGDGADSTLVFVLAYPSQEAREAAWKAFAADPEWQKAKAESEKDGVLVSKADSRYLVATDYSPVK
jgi:hypothetical protein